MLNYLLTTTYIKLLVLSSTDIKLLVLTTTCVKLLVLSTTYIKLLVLSITDFKLLVLSATNLVSSLLSFLLFREHFSTPAVAPSLALGVTEASQPTSDASFSLLSAYHWFLSCYLRDGYGSFYIRDGCG